MGEKAGKKVRKITHVKLKKKAGERFNFAAPYDINLSEERIKAPKIETRKSTTFVDVPDFLEFKATKQKNILEDNSELSDTQLLKVENDDELETKPQGSFLNYFQENNVFQNYRTKALRKSILFALFNTVSFAGLLILGWAQPQYTLLAVFIVGWLYIQTFVTLCLFATDKLVVTLVILLQGLSILFATALVGLFGLVSLVAACLIVLILFVVSQEVERRQILSRIVDYRNFLQPSFLLLVFVLAITLFISSSHLQTHSQLTQSLERQVAREELKQLVRTNSSYIQPLYVLTEVKPYTQFTTNQIKTVADVVIDVSYDGKKENVVQKEEYAAIGITPFTLEEEKKLRIESETNKRLIATLKKEFLVTNSDLEAVVDSGVYADLISRHWYQQISTYNNPLFVASNNLFSINFSLGSAVYSLFFATAVILIFVLYSIATFILRLVGISFEGMWWWLIIKTKLVTIGIEKVESEVLLL